MISFMLRRREELHQWPMTRATGSPTGGKGSHHNTDHLNLKRTIPWATSPAKSTKPAAPSLPIAAKPEPSSSAEPTSAPISNSSKSPYPTVAQLGENTAMQETSGSPSKPSTIEQDDASTSVTDYHILWLAKAGNTAENIAKVMDATPAEVRQICNDYQVSVL